MSSYSRPSPRALFRDRRVQVGGAVALSAAALLGAGVIAILARSEAEATPPEMNRRARLSIIYQPAPPPEPPVVYDKAPTLDPQQIAAENRERLLPSRMARHAEEPREQPGADSRGGADQSAVEAQFNPERLDRAPPTDNRPAQPGGANSSSAEALTAQDTAPDTAQDTAQDRER